MKGKGWVVIDKFHNQPKYEKRHIFSFIAAAAATHSTRFLLLLLLPPLLQCVRSFCLVRSTATFRMVCSNVHGAWCVFIPYSTLVWQVHYRNVGKNERVLVVVIFFIHHNVIVCTSDKGDKTLMANKVRRRRRSGNEERKKERQKKAPREQTYEKTNSKLMRRSTCLVGLVYLANMNEEMGKKPYINHGHRRCVCVFVWRLLCANRDSCDISSSANLIWPNCISPFFPLDALSVSRVCLCLHAVSLFETQFLNQIIRKTEDDHNDDKYERNNLFFFYLNDEYHTRTDTHTYTCISNKKWAPNNKFLCIFMNFDFAMCMCVSCRPSIVTADQLRCVRVSFRNALCLYDSV